MISMFAKRSAVALAAVGLGLGLAAGASAQTRQLMCAPTES